VRALNNSGCQMGERTIRLLRESGSHLSWGHG